jgi:hypothetical protein
MIHHSLTPYKILEVDRMAEQMTGAINAFMNPEFEGDIVALDVGDTELAHLPKTKPLPNLIGLVGYKGSGKDTVANILVNRYGYHKLSFASKLKDMVADLYGLDRVMLEGVTEQARLEREKPLRKISNKSAREILQLFGTEVCRHIHRNTWVDYLIRQIKPGQKYVITDCRFINEATAIIRVPNSFLLGIIRPDTDPKIDEVAIHESEAYISMIHEFCDDKIYNNCVIEELEKKVIWKLDTLQHDY